MGLDQYLHRHIHLTSSNSLDTVINDFIDVDLTQNITDISCKIKQHICHWSNAVHIHCYIAEDDTYSYNAKLIDIRKLTALRDICAEILEEPDKDERLALVLEKIPITTDLVYTEDIDVCCLLDVKYTLSVLNTVIQDHEKLINNDKIDYIEYYYEANY